MIVVDIFFQNNNLSNLHRFVIISLTILNENLINGFHQLTTIHTINIDSHQLLCLFDVMLIVILMLRERSSIYIQQKKIGLIFARNTFVRKFINSCI